MGTVRIGRIAGIDILVHWSWFFIFGLLVWTLGQEDGLYGQVTDNWSAASRWTAAVVSTLLFFLSVLLHELSHSLMAKRLNLPVAHITLFIFGGVSALTEDPKSAKEEFKVAIVGPLTSFIIGGVAGAVFLLAFLADVEGEVPFAVAGYLAFVNIAVGIFNMLPGYPLDGGRVLRAGLWAKTRNVLKATRYAATAGSFIAFGLMALGALSLLAGAIIGGLWFIVIGWFLRNTSEQAYQQVLLKSTLEGATVSEMVNRSFVAAPPDASLAQIVNEYILGHGQRYVPIVVADDLLGIVTMTDLRNTPSDQWATTSAFRAMTPREKLHTVAPGDELVHALQIMAQNDIHQLPVIDGNRDFLGFVTRSDLLRLIQVRTELAGAQQN